MSNIDSAEETSGRRGPGRSRNADRQPERERPERVMRDGKVSVDQHGRVSVEGRDGEMLARRHSGLGDKDIFDIPQNIIPPGWDYQWNVYTVAGMPSDKDRLGMIENGWRPVPAERHAGLFMPADYKGPIIRDGLILDERPLALSEEARRDDNRRAVAQVSDKNRELGLKDKLPRGFSDSRERYKGAGTQIKTQIDPGYDIPRPQYELASGGE